MGYSYIANMLFVVMVNIVALIAEQIAKCVRRRKEKAWLKKTENYREMIKRQIILVDKLNRRAKMREEEKDRQAKQQLYQEKLEQEEVEK
jgi:hypothetical protein